MATAQSPAPQKFILYGVSWQEYGRLLRALAERPSLRLTYDRGTLELMTLSLEHESLVRFFDLLILALTLEFRLPMGGGGSMSFRRRGRRRGLQSDECYWIASEPLVLGKETVALRCDPLRNLALEVDVSYSTLDRMKIYAALSLPEVWRYDGKALIFYVLGSDGAYLTAPHSKAMPQVRSADLAGLLALRGTMDENSLFQHFESWARQHFGSGQAIP